MVSSSTRFLTVTVIAPRVYRSGVTQRRSFDFVQVSCGSALFPLATLMERLQLKQEGAAAVRSAGGAAARSLELFAAILRGVNGGLNATPVPTGAPRPTVSTRAACL